MPSLTVRARSIAVALVAASMLLTSCANADDDAPAPADEPRALTAAEAESLAVARFRMYNESPVSVEMTWPGDSGSEFSATLDLRDHAAWGSFVNSEPAGLGLLAWDLGTVATAPLAAGTEVDASVRPPGLAKWTQRELTSEVPMDLFLAVALNLGADRPDNPLLLRQSSARFLRTDEVDGESVSVFEGPQPAEGDGASPSPRADAETPAAGTGRTRYWLADDGSLVRFEAYLGDANGEMARIDIVDPLDLPAGLEKRAKRVLASRG